MTVQHSDIYLKNVEDWEKKSAINLTPVQHTQLLISAIHAIERRALKTLSSVTLLVILDRIIHQTQEKYSLLAEIKLDPHGMKFDEIISKTKNYKSEELIEALRYLLVELLRVLGRITADILTAPLVKELLTVAWNDSEDT